MEKQVIGLYLFLIIDPNCLEVWCFYAAHQFDTLSLRLVNDKLIITFACSLQRQSNESLSEGN